MAPSRRRARSGRVFVVAAVVAGSALSGAASGHAQVTTSITSSGLGTVVTPPPAGTGTVVITGGTPKGSNLFHSFGEFSVGAGDAALFNGPGGTVNIVGRVTGGAASMIDGGLGSNPAGANLFLINPNGIMFGPNAALNVNGAFHLGSFNASTADYVGFGDKRFYANAASDAAADSVLTLNGLAVPDPGAFGFLNPVPAGISVAASTLQVGTGQTLSLVGGDVEVTGGLLTALGGRIQIASVASAGEVTIPGLSLTAPTPLGTVRIAEGSRLDASGDPAGTGAGGTVVIRGGQLFIDGSAIAADTLGDVDGAPIGIHLEADGALAVSNGASVGTQVLGAGRGGDIVLVGGTVSIDGFSSITSLNQSFGPSRGGDITIAATDSVSLNPGIVVSTTLSGDGGAITVSAPSGSLTMDNGAVISSATSDVGPGGNIVVDVGTLSMTGGAVIQSTMASSGPGGTVTVSATGAGLISGVSFDSIPSGILSSSFGEGPPGDIAAEFGSLRLLDGAVIQSGTAAGTQGGSVTVTARDSILIAGRSPLGASSGISSQAFVQGVGPVTVSVPTGTVILDDGFISTSTLETGGAGDIVVNARTLILQRGGQITSDSFQAPGAGGNVTITATERLSISGRAPGGTASSPLSTDPSSGIFSTASGTGPGGNIAIEAGQVTLSDGATISASSTTPTDPAGAAGNIHLNAGALLRLDNSRITTGAVRADGGNITILHTGSLLHMTDSEITTSVGQGAGRGGNITIGGELDPDTLVVQNVNPFDFIVLNNSGVHANAFGGPGGNINLFTGVLLSSLPIATAVTASSALSTPGTIDIQANVTDVSGGVAPLPESILQAASLLRAACAARLAGGASSSLVVSGREALPPEPGGLLSSSLVAESAEADVSLLVESSLEPGLPIASLWAPPARCSW